MKRKWTALVLTLSMVCALVLTAQAAEANYSDTADHYAAGVIGAWSGYGVLKGYEDGTFRPDGTITRAELAAVLNRVMGYQDAAENTFTDLPGELWYTDGLLRLAKQGIFRGGEDGKMNPEAPITRQETFAAMARALALEESEEPTGFQDDATISDWAKGYVSAMKQAGYIEGDQKGNIRANEPITRAEVVTILNKMVSAFVNTDGTYSEDCKGSLFVNAQNVTLKDMTIDGDLVITDGVGNGDVTLENVKVKGTLVVRGGGENSIHIVGDASQYGAVVITKTASGRVRLISEKGAVIPIINVDDGVDGVLLEGLNKTQVIVANDVEVTLGREVKSVKVAVNAPGAEVKVADGATVASLDVAITATDSKLTVEKGARVTNLTLAAKGAVENNGSVSRIKVEADGIQIDGKRPGSLVVASGVSKPTGSGAKSAAASFDGGSSSASTPPPSAEPSAVPTATPSTEPSAVPTATPSTEPSAEPTATPSAEPSTEPSAEPSSKPTQVVSAINIGLPSPRTGITAVKPTAMGSGYVVTSAEWVQPLVDGKFQEATAYDIEITVSPSTGDHYFAPEILDSVSVVNSVEYGAKPSITDRRLTEKGNVELVVSYPATSAVVFLKVISVEPENIELYSGLYCQWLRLQAHVVADGEILDDRPIQYEWYYGMRGQEAPENNEDYFWENSSQRSKNAIPSPSLGIGSHYYTCKITAEGCETAYQTYCLRVNDGTGIKFDPQLAKLVNRDGTLCFDFTQSDEYIKPPHVKASIEFTPAVDEKTSVEVDTGLLRPYIDMFQTMRYIVPQDTPGDSVTVNKIHFEALAVDKVTPIAEPLDYACNIAFQYAGQLPMSQEKASFVYDPARDSVIFRDLDHYADFCYLFRVGDWTSQMSPMEGDGSEYVMPLARISDSYTVERLRNGEAVSADVCAVRVSMTGETAAVCDFRVSDRIYCSIEDSGNT